MRLAYWMYEGTAHYGIARLINSLRGVHAVFHAPQGDDYIHGIFAMLERAPDFPPVTTSVVDGRDLAQGTIRLPDTLRQIEASYKPELIVVTPSCSTILLQENLEVTAMVSGIDCEVIVYEANPYRMQEHLAADNLFTVLVKRYAEATLITERPSVNIIGPASLGFHARHDLVSLRRMLNTLGVQVNVVAPWGASLDDLRRLPAAWVNVAPYRELGQKAAVHLEERFGTLLLRDTPIGVQPTLRWLNQLIEMLNTAAVQHDKNVEITLPPLTAFSLDGMSAPSMVPWFSRTADMDSFSGKTAFMFGDATHVVGVTKFLADELGMPICGAGTYLRHEADWVREQLDGYVDDLLVTDEFQTVARRIEELRPEVVCGTQMERHTARKLDLNCMVIAPPTHIENHLLSYRPFLGFDGADVIADEVSTTATLGMEKHLIDLFGDAGLEAPVHSTNGHTASAPTNGVAAAVADAPPVAAPPASSGPLAADAPVQWDADAERLLKKIPFFVRAKARANVEKYAREHGHSLITADILNTAREHIGG